jgi:hypothetical protein
MNCDICQKAQATTINDGDRVCAPCDAIIKDLLAKHPELSEPVECLGCGTVECEDALCKQQRADDLEERLYADADVPTNDYNNDDEYAPQEGDADYCYLDNE